VISLSSFPCSDSKEPSVTTPLPPKVFVKIGAPLLVRALFALSSLSLSFSLLLAQRTTVCQLVS
jgi:hypothetical protein